MNPIAHLRQNLVAYLALFVALGTGTAYAANQITGKDIARNAVKAKHIKDGQVKTAELGAGAVTGAKVVDNSLTGAEIDESTLQLPAPTAAPTPPAPDLSGYAKVTDLGGFVKVVAQGYLSGAGPLFSGDRCNGVGTSVPGVQGGDYVVITPGSLTEDVTFTGAVNTDFVSYQACYTADTGEAKLNGDVRYLVLRPQS